ncbi:cathepsin L-like proteinase [Anoplophora glabripennis]|uniref:cathepsin L-like proteinase n=1 Tax=Anoplophora glabripennis TaxID=217634 RepID=UPI0008746B71|nr:cathepsin L-like proteinase [Anoplophora glabripennis]
MRFLIILTSLVLAINAATDKELWLEFKKTHGKDYRNIREEQVRFSVFQQNLRSIEEHNEKYHKGEKSYYLGVTQYSDLSKEEFLSMLNYSRVAKPSEDKPGLSHQVADVVVPTEVNWVTQGAVTEVKNQGNCGSCWAFSTTGALEGAYAIKYGTKVSLSEQNLMDCSIRYGNSGCNGGVMQFAYTYVRDYGIEQEFDYPYSGYLGACRFSNSLSVLKVWQYMSIPAGDEIALQNAVATAGPVSVAVNADYFQQYAGGIFSEPYCTGDLNHGVLVVGYGEEYGSTYWLVKNSWGPSWGEGGYIKIAKNSGNECGIATDATYPILR